MSHPPISSPIVLRPSLKYAWLPLTSATLIICINIALQISGFYDEKIMLLMHLSSGFPFLTENILLTASTVIYYLFFVIGISQYIITFCMKLDAKFTIHPTRGILIERGIITKNYHRLAWHAIIGSSLTQKLSARILDYGHLTILCDDGDDTNEQAHYLFAIPQPKHYRQLIQEHHNYILNTKETPPIEQLLT